MYFPYTHSWRGQGRLAIYRTYEGTYLRELCTKILNTRTWADKFYFQCNRFWNSERVVLAGFIEKETTIYSQR
jgi:hypothetical protein